LLTGTSIISEAGTGYNQQPTETDVQSHVTGVRNLLQWAKMLPGAPTPPAAPQLKLEAKFRDVKAGVAGMFKHGPDREDRVQKGGIVGTICDLDGTVLQELRAPCDAVVHEMMPKRLVYPGDSVYTLAVIAPW
jgi:predicted deacylase